MTAPQADATTDPQSIIAALQQRLDAALSEKAALAEALATRNSEYGERIEQQSATIDVLRAMSASPGDPQPVFDLIATRARDLCDAYGVTVFEFDGTLIHWRAATGVSDDPIVRRAAQAMFPMAPTREWGVGRAILECRVIRIDDLETEPGLSPALRAGTAKSSITIPLMRGDVAIGALALASRERGGFTKSQIELFKTFAEQAVIAISSAETYRALRTRTADLQESLEYQTATSDVLKVISRSTFDLQPVLTMVAETAVRLCFADQAAIFRLKDDIVHLAGNYGFPTEYKAYWDELGPVPLGKPIVTALSTTIYERHSVHIHDVAAVPGYPDEAIKLGKQRTSLGVPLLRESEPIGVILLARQRVEAFTDRQIGLVSTFADQAVIAIENTRLLTEQQEALEQQTATAEVLAVINTSPGDLMPVFDAMLEKAMRLCGAAYAVLRSFDGAHLGTLASRGVPSAYAEFLARTGNADLEALGANSMSGTTLMQALRTGQPTQMLDVRDGIAYKSRMPGSLAIADLGGARTILHVPLVKDLESVGLFTIYRQEVRGFSEKQIALLENFAAQAVIAMENARLINETREALEQRTATAEVLQVINSSPGNLAPVFEAMLEKALRLCDAAFGNLWTYDGEVAHLAAICGASPEYRAELMRMGPQKPEPGASLIRLIEGEPLVHIADIMTEGAHRSGVAVRRMLANRAGARTVLWVPLRKDGALLGFFTIYRTEVRPFTDKQIALLQTFAAQAVIAIENARLLTEQREALEQQTATAEVLQVINANPGNLAPVFDAMLEKAMRLCGAAFGSLYTYDGKQFNSGAHRGVPAAYAAFRGQNPPVARPGSAIEQCLETKHVIHRLDVMASDNYLSGNPYARAMVQLGGIRTDLTVPLLKDHIVLGFIQIYRQEVLAFSDKQIALLENFAAQAVIAMENARLMAEQREALEQQTATAEVLQVINASPGELASVFGAMLEKALRLCGADFGILGTYDGARFRWEAHHGLPDWVPGAVVAPEPGSALERVANGERVVHIQNLVDTDAYRNRVHSRVILVEKNGARAGLWVALRKDATVLGVILIYRREPRAFSDKQIALLQNFAAQAVIAMENARLITETQEALEQQTATAEVLQVINASPGNLTPVFEAILDKAHRACGASVGSLVTYDGELFRVVIAHGYPEQVREILRQPFCDGLLTQGLTNGERLIHIPDIKAVEFGPDEDISRALVEYTNVRTRLFVPLRKDGNLLGYISAYRREVRPFSEKEISLLENFATQAVIAMENARLLDEIRRHQEELRVTFENMGDGVAMFDETQHLAAWNRKFQDILDVPDDIIARRQTFSEYVHYLAERGEYGHEANPEEHVRRLIEQAGQARTYERARPDGRVIEIRHNPVPGGGFVLIYADIAERKRNEAEIRAARDAAEEASRTIEAAYRDLKAAQANLIQAEKMASLGQLTAGIAHEIKNPLNFVNNFAALSVDLLSELKETAAPGFAALTEKQRAEVDEVSVMLTSNLEKITEHGKRADGIVKAMLEHSRGSSGERRMVDLNTVIDEALNLAYHGARAQDQSFNITLERDFGGGIAPIEVNPQDMTRVFLNIFSNGFYAATRRTRNGGDTGFVPTLKVTTRDAGEAVEIRARDNGTGIPAEIRDKLFEPFFSTKPTGEGTGLGLSITYDIVTKQHGGTITVESEVDAFTEFVVTLPRQMFADGGSRT